MKRTLAIILTLFISFSSVSIFADETSSNSMARSLLIVKEKIEIPETLTEFTSSVRDQGGKTYYNFNWQDKDYNSNLSVKCDSEGRIYEYYHYDNNEQNESVFSDITKPQIITFADTFMRELVPEAFADSNDCLVLDESSFSANSNLSYYLYYDRYKDGIKVKNNNGSIRINIINDKIFVRNVSINFDYDADFETSDVQITDAERSYFEKYPVELIYRDEYDYKAMVNGEPDKKIIMLYRIKDSSAGYISAKNGEIVEESNDLYDSSNKNESASDMAPGASGGGGSSFTEQELTELENIGDILSKDEILSIIKSLPHVNFNSDLKLNSFRITSNRKDDYFINTEYSNDKDDEISYRFAGKFDGKSGKVLSFSNYRGDSYKYTASDEQKTKAEKSVGEFLNFVCPDELKSYKEHESYWGENNLYKSYNRFVNDVKYINDTIYVSYDAYFEGITNYTMDYDKKAVFESVEGVIGDSAAENSIIKNASFNKIYIKSEGMYKLCYGLDDSYIEINAKTGESLNKSYEKDDNYYEYTDMSEHWAENAVCKLASVDIGFNGDTFNPDKFITQKELLALFGAGIYYNSYLDYDEDTLYQRMYDNKILTPDQKAPDAPVKREDAFIFMIRMANLEKIAKAENIFKIEYADEYTISQDNIGYAAILTGLNVVSGYGGYLRGNENTTRAEAAMMLYKYMLNK